MINKGCERWRKEKRLRIGDGSGGFSGSNNKSRLGENIFDFIAKKFFSGHQFIDEFFIQHHFQRYTSNKYLHPQPFWFFFVVLPLMTLPWMPRCSSGCRSGPRAVSRWCAGRWAGCCSPATISESRSR